MKIVSFEKYADDRKVAAVIDDINDFLGKHEEVRRQFEEVVQADMPEDRSAAAALLIYFSMLCAKMDAEQNIADYAEQLISNQTTERK